MALNSFSNDSTLHSQRIRMLMVMCILAFITLAPDIAFAADDDACGKVAGFADNVKGLLNGISIIVVTIAVIFSGYQIAFAHKRMGDVAPVLIGAILIGAAGQIANMFLAGNTACAPNTTMYVSHLLNHYA